MTLTHEQLHTLALVERCASILSIFGIATIIGTFLFSRQFRNPIHRLVFINAFYNLFDVTATTISLSGPDAGNGSALCQFQGFLMQMYVQGWQSYHLQRKNGKPILTTNLIGFHWQMYFGHLQWLSMSTLLSFISTMLQPCASSRSSTFL